MQKSLLEWIVPAVAAFVSIYLLQIASEKYPIITDYREVITSIILAIIWMTITIIRDALLSSNKYRELTGLNDIMEGVWVAWEIEDNVEYSFSVMDITYDTKSKSMILTADSYRSDFLHRSIWRSDAITRNRNDIIYAFSGQFVHRNKKDKAIGVTYGVSKAEIRNRKGYVWGVGNYCEYDIPPRVGKFNFAKVPLDYKKIYQASSKKLTSDNNDKSVDIDLIEYMIKNKLIKKPETDFQDT